MRRMTYFLMALAMVLGITQCKKEQTPANNQTEGVFITLNVNGGNNNSRVDVNPNAPEGYATVEFEEGDSIFVGYHNAYVGVLKYQGGSFSGTVNISASDYGEKLHFYFLGGKGFEPTVSGNTATVNISNQTERYPVISYNISNEAFSGTGSYSSRLKNKCSIMKFNVTTPSTAPICITGMNNEVTVNFNPETEDERFTYGMNAEDGGLIKMKGQAGEGEKTYWAIVLPQEELTTTGDAYSEDHSYTGTRPAIHAIESNKYYHEGGDVINMTVNTHVWNGNLSTLTGDEPADYAKATDGMTIYGTLTSNSVKVSIADGANVTLQDATINRNGSSDSNAGLTLLGSATITLVGNSNILGTTEKAGIYVPSNKTLTICGEGTINSTGGTYGAGIGGNYKGTSGNIVISEGTTGTINATGGYAGAGIGSGYQGSNGTIEISAGIVNATGNYGGAGIGSGNRGGSGSITINGGTVNATGANGGAAGDGAPGIGSGIDGSCGAITINDGVTLVTATKGSDAPCSIGKGSSASCGTVTIGGTVYPDGATPNQGDGLTFVYPVPLPEGVINGLFSVSSTKQVYFSKGSLQYIGSASTPYWKFADNQWDLLSITNQNTNNTNVDRDIFSWGTSGYAHGASIYQPWGHGTINNQFYAYGDQANYLSASTGTADWGYNAISNGGNQEHLWYTLNKDEWTYLFSSDRPGSTVNGTDKAHYARATVEGINGVILFPDIYTHPTDVNQPNYINSNSGGWANTYTAADFMKMEAHGAVFLPAGGGYVGGNIVNRNVAVFYWSSQPDNGNADGNALGLHLSNNSINCANSMYRHLGIGVRLVRNVE